MPLSNDQKLKKLLDLMDHDGITSEQFVRAFEQVTKFVMDIRSANEKERATMEKAFVTLAKSLETEAVNTKSSLSGASESAKRELTATLNSAIKELRDIVDAKLMEVTNGNDGKDADEERIIAEVSQKLATIIPPKQTPEEIRDGLETLRGEERLDVSAIKNLQETLDEIRKMKASGGRMTGMRKIPIVKRYRLTDQCNGVLKSFTLPADTTDVLGVFGTQFPINYDPYNASGGDWTFKGRTLTLGDGVSAPETGQTLWALIETLFY